MTKPIEVVGFAALLRSLSKLNLRGRTRDVDEGMLDALHRVADRWRSGVNVDDGDYRRSIKVSDQIEGDEENRAAMLGIDPSEDSEGRLHVYPRIEELGGPNRRANPAFRRAVEAESAEVRRLMKRHLKGVVAELVKEAKR